jgi:two-component sensor histidine kinase
VEGRFAALARANSLIAEGRWTAVDLHTLVEEELRPFAGDRVAAEGPAVYIKAASAQSLAMVLHELATNAVKYGALSAGGEVRVHWRFGENGSLMLSWEETGGPTPSEPTRKGTGTAIITGAVRQLGGELFREWTPDGLRCTIMCGAASL